ncbi:uncharacterized protein LOC133187154 [Saccostrea echinata]|uniref:uncharacterized protein LOC133187154 n=1 Tax=Saccostrea echinata TaxID=191078 RepID=UPI002A82BA56|nr:uncharacterized protein LOC133187154 [Saccostrea echinata]
MEYPANTKKAKETRCECPDCVRFHSLEPSTTNTGSEIRDPYDQIDETPLQVPEVHAQDETDRNRLGGASADLSINQQTNSTEISTSSRNLDPTSEHEDCTCYRYKRSAAKSQPIPTRSVCLESSILRTMSFTILYSIPRGSTTVNAEKPIIYLTFSDESKRHTREIRKLCEKLRDSLEFSVKCDKYDALRKVGELNIHGWRDLNYGKAKWILFCISPGYSKALRAGEYNSPVAEINEQEQGIVYIHNIARAEFQQNGSKNYRMIPLLFTKTKASVSDIPYFLSSSPYFMFPEHKEDLFRLLRTQRQH